MNPKYKWFVKQNGAVKSKHATYAAANKSLSKLVQEAEAQDRSHNANIFDAQGVVHTMFPILKDGAEAGCCAACSCQPQPEDRYFRLTVYEKIEKGDFDIEDSYNHPLFLTALCREAGLDPKHPKVEQLFSIAWEMGHCAGLSEVAIYFDQMSVLLKE